MPMSMLELARRGDAETLSQMLADEDERVDLQSNPQRSRNGDTALHVAASGGHLRAVIVLLGAGAQVDALGQRRRTPLHCAVAHGHLAVAQRLLDAGAEIDLKDEDGASALDLAVENGFAQIVRLLLEKGAQPDVKLVTSAASQDNNGLLELFLQHGVSVDACDESGDSLLVHAARAKKWEHVQSLLEKGASPAKCKGDHDCALVFATRDGQAAAVRQLLCQLLPQPLSEPLPELLSRAKTEARQVKWAFWEAKNADVVSVFEELLPGFMQTQNGRWGILLAAVNGRREVLVKMLESTNEPNIIEVEDSLHQRALHHASRKGHVECVEELLKRHADRGAKGHLGNTPLHWASMHGFAECVTKLLEGEVCEELNAAANDGRTPLHLACGGGHLECVEKLLEKGAEANSEAKDGWTPLHWASHGGHSICVQKLLDTLADEKPRRALANATAKDGRTPLHLASGAGHVEGVQTLLAAGANAAVKNKLGQTPLDVATTDDVRRAFSQPKDGRHEQCNKCDVNVTSRGFQTKLVKTG